MGRSRLKSTEYAVFLQESTNTVRRASLTLYLVGAYMVATSLEVTHQQLLASSQKISLPLINVPVDLTSFYSIAPFIFFAIQVKFLLHLFAHEDKIESVKNNYLRSKNGPKDEIKNILPISLFNLTYGYFKQRYLKWFLLAIYFAMNYAFPILVLLFFQISFLPYHHHILTPVHQGLTLMSIAFSCLIYLRGSKPKLTRKKITKWALRFWPLLIFSPLFIYVALVLDFPQTELENNRTIPFTNKKLNDWISRNIVIENQSLMEVELGVLEETNSFYRAMDSLISISNLDSSELVELSEASTISSSIIENAAKSRDFTKQSYEKGILVDSGRDLRFAKFTNVVMRNSVFNGVDLSGSIFSDTDFTFSSANNSDLSDAFILNSSFSNSKLMSADLSNVLIEKSDFSKSSLYRSNLTNSKIALTTFESANLIGIVSESSNWVANNLKNSFLATSNLNKSFFIVNQFEGSDLNNTNVSETFFISSELLSESFRTTFGYTYVPKKMTPEQIRIGFSRQYFRFQQHDFTNSDYYDSPREAFSQLGSTLEFLISVKSDSAIPDLATRQEDQMRKFFIPKEGSQEELEKFVGDEIERSCPNNDDIEIREKSDEIVANFPVFLTQLKNFSRIQDKKVLSESAKALISIYSDAMKSKCGVDHFIKDLPERIPYLKSSLPGSFTIDYIDIEKPGDGDV